MSGRQIHAPIHVSIHARKRQAGFLIPLALFIVIGASTLAIAMSQMAAGARSSAVLTAFNAQAFYSADAGIQLALHKLYYNNDNQAAVDAACVAFDGSSINFTEEGLVGCSTELSCGITASVDGTVSVYNLLSQSTCGQGDYEVGRRVSASAYMKN
jgi:MSHA biogenesis protein MshP